MTWGPIIAFKINLKDNAPYLNKLTYPVLIFRIAKLWQIEETCSLKGCINPRDGNPNIGWLLPSPITSYSWVPANKKENITN